MSIFTHKRSQEYTWLTPNIYPVIVFVFRHWFEIAVPSRPSSWIYIIKYWLDLTHFVFSNSIQNKQCFAILQLGVFVLVKGTLIVNSLASLQWISCCCYINFDWIHKIAWICMPLTFVSQTVKPCYLELNRSIYRKTIEISKVCRIRRFNNRDTLVETSNTYTSTYCIHGYFRHWTLANGFAQF